MRIFITHVAPREVGRKAGVSVAATNFSYNLIDGCVFDKCYSVLPPFVKGIAKTALSDSRIDIKYSSFRNSPIGKVAPILEQWEIFKKIPNGASVWLYNITPLNAYLIKLLRNFKPKVRIFAIVLDYTPGDPKAEKFLPLINECDGRILLSTSKLFDNKNTKCLPGVVPLNEDVSPMIAELNPEFLISGQFSEQISLLSRLLPVFSKLSNATLHISGAITDMARQYAAKYPNIILHENLTFEQYLNLLHSVTFQLSTRNPNMPENECNFPSKIIEALLHNRIVVSTINYPQLGAIKYIKVDADNLEEDIASIIDNISAYKEYANQSILTKEMFNTAKWLDAMEQIEKNISE